MFFFLFKQKFPEKCFRKVLLHLTKFDSILLGFTTIYYVLLRRILSLAKCPCKLGGWTATTWRAFLN